MLNPTPHTLETVNLSLESEGNKAESNRVIKHEVEERTLTTAASVLESAIW